MLQRMFRVFISAHLSQKLCFCSSDFVASDSKPNRTPASEQNSKHKAVLNDDLLSDLRGPPPISVPPAADDQRVLLLKLSDVNLHLKEIHLREIQAQN